MIDQVVIGICGLSSVMLSQDHRPALRRYACLFGLIAQPFWFYSAWHAQQWGIMGLCFVYTWGWFKGFRNFWILGRPA